MTQVERIRVQHKRKVDLLVSRTPRARSARTLITQPNSKTPAANPRSDFHICWALSRRCATWRAPSGVLGSRSLWRYMAISSGVRYCASSDSIRLMSPAWCIELLAGRPS